MATSLQLARGRDSAPSASGPGATRRRWPASGGMLRVPEITAYFWIIKGLSTALGEAASGASIADWLGKPYLGGLGLGDGRVSLVLAAMILALVAYLAVTRKDVPG